MPTEVAITGLQLTTRRRLLRHLRRLNDADPLERAKAALAASHLMLKHELDWGSLLPPGTYATETATPPPDWRTQALVLAHHPAVSATKWAFPLKLASWRGPGGDGLARLREIAGRTGVET